MYLLTTVLYFLYSTLDILWQIQYCFCLWSSHAKYNNRMLSYHSAGDHTGDQGIIVFKLLYTGTYWWEEKWPRRSMHHLYFSIERTCNELTWLSSAGVENLGFSASMELNAIKAARNSSLFFSYMKSKDISLHISHLNLPISLILLACLDPLHVKTVGLALPQSWI